MQTAFSLFRLPCIGLCILIPFWSLGQDYFKPLDSEIPEPNLYRSADGQPGPSYFQQKVDYAIEVELNDEERSISGQELITYYNNSPNTLDFLWLQLDQNIHSEEGVKELIQNQAISDPLEEKDLKKVVKKPFDSDFKIVWVKGKNGERLNYHVNNTLMRVTPEEAIPPNGKYEFRVSWSYVINDVNKVGGRSGYEVLDDGNAIFAIAQFYPRMALYNDLLGWELRQYLGQAEFGLEFGDFDVSITLPGGYLVGATGIHVNKEEMFSPLTIQKIDEALKSNKPVEIISKEEAIARGKMKIQEKKTWNFRAEKVRDFAFASSRKFIWEAKGVEIGDKRILAQAMFPPEADPLWNDLVVDVAAHTLVHHSKHTFDYPYPSALAIHINHGGMEYPMICFNGRRPDKNGEYSEYIKNRLIGLIIHEVGHNFFPMIVNSNERQWTWMDEGINSFLEYLAEKEWDPEFPSRRGPPKTVKKYMGMDPQSVSTVMTPAELVRNKGLNGYWKPSAAFNILREVVLGKDEFDFALKTYAERWKFKHPSPGDFFRTMNNASGTDLNWFWRGWFFTKDHVDISIDSVTWLKVENNKPYMGEYVVPDIGISEEASMTDLYTFRITEGKDAIEYYRTYMKETWDIKAEKDFHIYQLHFQNLGGIPMPILFRINYADGTTEDMKFPAEVWRKDNREFVKAIIRSKEVKGFIIDPEEKSADLLIRNNYWPRNPAEKSSFGDDEYDSSKQVQKD